MNAPSSRVLRNYVVLAGIALGIGSGSVGTQERVRVIEDLTNYYHAEFVDVDQDGDIDWVSMEGPNRLDLLLNDGLGNFFNATVGRIPNGLVVMAGYPLQLIVRDVTGDGLVDILYPYALIPGPGIAIGPQCQDSCRLNRERLGRRSRCESRSPFAHALRGWGAAFACPDGQAPTGR